MGRPVNLQCGFVSTRDSLDMVRDFYAVKVQHDIIEGAPRGGPMEGEHAVSTRGYREL